MTKPFDAARYPTYGPEMVRRLQQLRAIGRATFPEHLRGVEALGLLSITLLVGLAATGIWQFLFYEPDPDWYDYAPGAQMAEPQSQPAVGIAEVHGLLSDVAGVVTLVGASWFAYRIVQRVTALMVVAFCCVTFAALTGAALRFNILRQTGVPIEELSGGYAQLFTTDVEYLVTDRNHWGAGGSGKLDTFRIALIAHILSIPVLVGFAWRSIRRGLDRWTMEIENAPKRTWITGSE